MCRVSWVVHKHRVCGARFQRTCIALSMTLSATYQTCMLETCTTLDQIQLPLHGPGAVAIVADASHHHAVAAGVELFLTSEDGHQVL